MGRRQSGPNPAGIPGTKTAGAARETITVRRLRGSGAAARRCHLNESL